MVSSLIGGGDSDCGGKTGVARMSSQIPEAEFRASISLCEAAFAPSSP